MNMEKKKNRSALRMLVLISQLGICMMTPTFFCVFVGQFLSRRLNQELIFPFLVLLGMMAGFRSCYTVIIRGEEKHLFFEWTNSAFASRVARWYVETMVDPN